MEKIVLTGGGTAGHITPNIALLPFLKEYEIHYIGRSNSMEQELMSAYPQVTFHEISAVKLERKLTLKNLAIPFKLNKSKREAKAILEKLQPKVIFSKGGFVALPVTLSAKNIPVILHESDMSAGLANKLGIKKAKIVCTSFPQTAEKFKNGVWTGAPLRQTLYLGNKLRATTECRLTGRRNLLIFGGSLGAAAINDTVFNCVKMLTKYYDVVHITGKNNKRVITDPRYFSLPFTNNIADYFAWADVVVSRGGANALFELAALKKPSLVIPLPKKSSRGDQIENARYFESCGYCHVLPQESMNGETLLNAIFKLEENHKTVSRRLDNAAHIDGTKTIAELIIKCARGGI